MGQYFNFPSTLTALSNEKAFCLRKELPPVLQIIGRIPPSIVYNYVSQLRSARTKDVILLRLDRPGKFSIAIIIFFVFFQYFCC